MAKNKLTKGQEIGQFNYLPINSLAIGNYQSPINPKRVKRIVDNFDKEQLQPIDVSFRDGIYYIVDGQHRVEALKILGKRNMLCKLHYDLTYQQEAYLYYNLNNPIDRRTPTAIHRFNALLEAGNPDAVDIKDLVEINGFDLGIENQGKAPNKIICVATLQKIYKDVGGTGLNRILRLDKATWDYILEAVDKNILMGIYAFVKTYGSQFTDKDFANSLSKVEPKRILTEGRSAVCSDNSYYIYARIMLNYFNKKRRNKLENKF